MSRLSAITWRWHALLDEAFKLGAAGLIERRSPSPEPRLTGLVIDSREVAPGTCFVALRGAHLDGHDFIPEALERGASAVILEQHRFEEFDALISPQVALASAPSTRGALGALSRAFYDNPLCELYVLGVTGTNGKTTTALIAESLLAQAGYRVGLLGTIAYRWPGVTLKAPNTTPESLTLQRLARAMLKDHVQVLVMEISSHALATHRMEGSRCDAAIFTNLTQDHLDFHGSMEAYEAAKRALFERHIKPGGVAILNLDSPASRRFIEGGSVRAGRLVGYSTSPPSDTSSSGQAELERPALDGLDRLVTIERLEVSLERTRLFSDALTFELPLLGGYNALNALGAALALEELGLMDKADLEEKLSKISPVPGRLERVNPGGAPAIFVDYAHTPDALKRLLEALKALCPSDGQLWCVFGCGGDRDRSKRPMMGHSAALLADRLVLTSDNPRSEDPAAILEAIVAGVPLEMRAKIKLEVSRAEAIEHAVKRAGQQDVIAIAGKGHEIYQQLAQGRVPFDDVEVARRALKERQR